MQSRRNSGGFTLIELMIAMAILAVVALSMANAFSTTTSASLQSDRALRVQSSLQSTYESVADVAYDQLLSWNGVVTAHGDHDVTIAANLVQVGMVELEFTVSDHRTGATLARLATYRSGEY
jgi:prepilin-type N-terminal cleavage/methylation domain-containing protein